MSSPLHRGNIRRGASGECRLLTALKNRATFALKNGPPSTQHFFATNALHPTVEGICGEKMFPGTLGAGPRESAKVASFESAVDTVICGFFNQVAGTPRSFPFQRPICR